MSNPFLISNLSVGHKLPNCWTVMAYAVSDRHALVLASISTGELDHPKISYASWSVSNEDLRSTSDGHYYETDIVGAWKGFQKRMTSMYMLS